MSLQRARRCVSSWAVPLVGAALLCLTLAGCGTYSNTALKIRTHAAGGELQSAISLLEKNGGKNPDVLNLLERGLLLNYAGRYTESNTALQTADQLIEDLYTKSVSSEAFAFLSNDATLPYHGYPHEQVLLHTYGALNYLALGDLESALVECRRAGLRLAAMESSREDKKGYSDDGFAEWLSALLYAEDGDGNACLVATRRALSAYEEAEQLWGHPIPPELLHDYLRWARRFGFADEASELAERFPDAAATLTIPPNGSGEVLMIFESGFVDRLHENRVDFPILEGEESNDADELGPVLYRRGSRHHYRAREDVKVAYWLSIAMPELVREPSHIGDARLVTQGHVSEAQLVADVSAVAQLTFDEGAGKRATRTIVRAIAKYTATELAKKKNEGLGFLTDILTSATERADTRSWTMLPDRIHMARMRLLPGIHRIVLEIFDVHGELAQTASFEEVEVVADEITVLHHRSYR